MNLSDPEISRQLALAIGWSQAEVFSMLGCLVRFEEKDAQGWISFDYRYWSVIGPIAEAFDLFPYRTHELEWTTHVEDYETYSTPQKAIAMAVIGAKKWTY
jgi:hypothetical protein